MLVQTLAEDALDALDVAPRVLADALVIVIPIVMVALISVIPVVVILVSQPVAKPAMALVKTRLLAELRFKIKYNIFWRKMQ